MDSRKTFNNGDKNKNRNSTISNLSEDDELEIGSIKVSKNVIPRQSNIYTNINFGNNQNQKMKRAIDDYIVDDYREDENLENEDPESIESIINEARMKKAKYNNLINEDLSSDSNKSGNNNDVNNINKSNQKEFNKELNPDNSDSNNEDKSENDTSFYLQKLSFINQFYVNANTNKDNSDNLTSQDYISMDNINKTALLNEGNVNESVNMNSFNSSVKLICLFALSLKLTYFNLPYCVLSLGIIPAVFLILFFNMIFCHIFKLHSVNMNNKDLKDSIYLKIFRLFELALDLINMVVVTVSSKISLL